MKKTSEILPSPTNYPLGFSQSYGNVQFTGCPKFLTTILEKQSQDNQSIIVESKLVIFIFKFLFITFY